MQTYKASGLESAGRLIVERFPMGHAIHVTAEIDGEQFATNYHSTDEKLMNWNAATRDMLVPMEAIDYRLVSKIALSRWGPHMDDLMPWLTMMDCKLIMAEGDTFINVVAPGVDKSTTLSAWFQTKGWGRKDVAVFGDDLPDIEMMQLSDYAVAMGNATPEVKAVAHHVIVDCDDDLLDLLWRDGFETRGVWRDSCYLIDIP